MEGWEAMREDWNVYQNRLEVRAISFYLACTAQLDYLVLFPRHQPRVKKGSFNHKIVIRYKYRWDFRSSTKQRANQLAKICTRRIASN